MLIQTTVQKKETITKEVSLPYHCKTGNNFFRINKEGSVTKVTLLIDHEHRVHYASIGVNTISEYDKQNIADSEECDAAEMEHAARQAMAYMEKHWKALVESEPFEPVTNDARHNTVKVDNTQVQY